MLVVADLAACWSCPSRMEDVARRIGGVYADELRVYLKSWISKSVYVLEFW
jgi:hypothetical protein